MTLTNSAATANHDQHGTGGVTQDSISLLTTLPAGFIVVKSIIGEFMYIAPMEAMGFHMKAVKLVLAMQA